MHATLTRSAFPIHILSANDILLLLLTSFITANDIYGWSLSTSPRRVLPPPHAKTFAEQYSPWVLVVACFRTSAINHLQDGPTRLPPELQLISKFPFASPLHSIRPLITRRNLSSLLRRRSYSFHAHLLYVYILYNYEPHHKC